MKQTFSQRLVKELRGYSGEYRRITGATGKNRDSPEPIRAPRSGPESDFRARNLTPGKTTPKLPRTLPRVFGLLMAGTLVFASFPAAAGSRPETTVKVAALNGPSAIPLAALFENPPVFAGITSEWTVAAGPDVVLPLLLKGAVDAAVLPINAAAKVFTANRGAVVLGGTMGDGMLTVLTRDSAVSSLADLQGKRLHVAGQGATPEYVTRHLLSSAGIYMDVRRSDAVLLDFSIPPGEMAAFLLAGKAAYAVVPEPFTTVVTMKDPSFRRAVDMQEVWAATEKTQGSFPMTALVVRGDFAKKKPETVRRLLAAVREAVEWTNAHPSEAGSLVEKHTLGLQASVAAAAVPHGAFVYHSSTEARESVEKLFSVFLAMDPRSIGGKLPDKTFYFE